MGVTNPVRVSIRMFATLAVAVLVFVAFQGLVTGEEVDLIGGPSSSPGRAPSAMTETPTDANATLDDVESNPVPPGEVFQAWDNSSLEPQRLRHSLPVKLLETADKITYLTSYGAFVLVRQTPLFVRLRHYGVSDEETSAAFLVRYDGDLLTPNGGGVDRVLQSMLQFQSSIGGSCGRWITADWWPSKRRD